MTPEANYNRVLVIQASVRPESIQRGRQILRPILQEAGRVPLFADGLRVNVSELARRVQFSEVLLTGSDAANLAQLEQNTPAGELARRYLHNTQPLLQRILNEEENIRVLGICFGHQALAYVAEKSHKPRKRNVVGKREEVGTFNLRLTDEAVNNPLFSIDKIDPEKLKQILMIFGHHDGLLWLPNNAIELGRTGIDPFSALSYYDGRIVTFQGHPELDALQAKIIAEAGGYVGNFTDIDSTEQLIVNFLTDKS